MEYKIQCVFLKDDNEIIVQENDIVKITYGDNTIVGQVDSIDHFECETISLITNDDKYKSIFLDEIKDIKLIMKGK